MFFLAGDLSITDCGGIEVLKVIKFVWSLLDIVFIFIPIGLILMIAFDFAKNVIAGKEDEMRKNLNLVIKRLIFCVVLFLVPTIVEFAINLLAGSGIDVVSNFNDCIEMAENKDLSSDAITNKEVVDEEVVDEEVLVEEVLDEEEKNSESEEIFDVDLPDSVRKEIFNYSLKVTSVLSSKNEKEKAYSDLSEMAKKIIDKEIIIVPKEIRHYVEAREDIIVPEGKILTNIGYRNALEGEVLTYNPDKNKYYSSSGGMGFSIENMANGKLIDK